MTIDCNKADELGKVIFLTERDVAERWRMSAKTLQNWRVSGRGPRFRKLGNSVRYLLSDIEEFEEACPRDSTSG